MNEDYNSNKYANEYNYLEWLPIESAPKDKRILLGYEKNIFNGINSVCGKWDDDKYDNNPKPFWTHDLYKLKGMRETRLQQPVYWMPLPEAPIMRDYT